MMTEQATVPDVPEEDNLFAMMADGLAHMDIFHHLDGWFGHWWNRPFWKAENPLRVFLENLTWQGHKRFSIPRKGDMSGYEVEVFLRDRGVYIWGRGFDSDSLYFNVKKEQASWAEYLMAREGITTTNTPVDPRNQAWAERYDSAPPGWGTSKRAFWEFLMPSVSSSGGPARRQPARTAQGQSRKRRNQNPRSRTEVAPLERLRNRRRRPARPRRPGQARRK